MLTYHIWKLCKCDLSEEFGMKLHTVQYSTGKGEKRSWYTLFAHAPKVPLVTCTLLCYTVYLQKGHTAELYCL